MSWSTCRSMSSLGRHDLSGAIRIGAIWTGVVWMGVIWTGVISLAQPIRFC